MNQLLRNCCVLFALLGSIQAYGQNVVEDEGVGLSKDELAYIVGKWPPQLQEAAANDVGDRLELVSKALATRKLAAEFDSLNLAADGDTYLEAILIIRDAKRRFMIDRFLETLEVPDMTALAKERYTTEKDTYALVGEQRMSSHILLLCNTADCVREEKLAAAESVLAELKAGANFEELVATYSEDPGTKAKAGRFDRWIGRDDTGVAKSYVIALHTLDKPGDYSAVVTSEFGFHIIRLDEIKPSHYRSFEEVEPSIVDALVKEYKKRALIDYVNSFGITEKAHINGPDMEDIFEKYKNATQVTLPPKP